MRAYVRACACVCVWGGGDIAPLLPPPPSPIPIPLRQTIYNANSILPPKNNTGGGGGGGVMIQAAEGVGGGGGRGGGIQVQCCFTSTETIRTIRDGEPRTATSTFTQLLSSERGGSGEGAKVLLYKKLSSSRKWRPPPQNSRHLFNPYMPRGFIIR